MRLILLVGLVALAPLAASTSASDLLVGPAEAEPDGGSRIGPGQRVSTSIGGCTLNFVFRDAARTYVGTAAHCVAGPGDRVENWGTVVWRGESASPCDFALIAIDPEDVARVDPVMPRWGGPTALAAREDAEAGTPLGIYGNGIGLGTLEPTRGRAGVLRLTNERIYASYVPAIFGDSGGPVVRLDTGEAFGVVATIGPYGTTLAGPHMTNVMARLARDGFDVELVTGAWSPLVPVLPAL